MDVLVHVKITEQILLAAEVFAQTATRDLRQPVTPKPTDKSRRLCFPRMSWCSHSQPSTLDIVLPFFRDLFVSQFSNLNSFPCSWSVKKEERKEKKSLQKDLSSPTSALPRLFPQCITNRLDKRDNQTAPILSLSKMSAYWLEYTRWRWYYRWSVALWVVCSLNVARLALYFKGLYTPGMFFCGIHLQIYTFFRSVVFSMSTFTQNVNIYLARK